MKKVIVEINGKKHGPLIVQGVNWKRVSMEETTVGLKELEAMGAIVIEVKDPLVWEGEVEFRSNSLGTAAYFSDPELGLKVATKSFRARLEEIVE